MVTGCGRRCSSTTEPGVDQLKISKSGKSGTGVRLRFDLIESSVVEQLFGELAAVLADETDDEVRRRLYPDAYADAEAEAAYRDLTEAGLRLERSERLDACLDELRAGRSLRRTEVVLDADGTERWLRVLNDLRLSLGTRLAISEDDSYVLDPNDPDAELRARYLWLTALQDSLVTAVMG